MSNSYCNCCKSNDDYDNSDFDKHIISVDDINRNKIYDKSDYCSKNTIESCKIYCSYIFCGYYCPCRYKCSYLCGYDYIVFFFLIF